MSGQSRAIAVGGLVTLLWSSSWLLVRWGDARSIDPVSFAAVRYLLAAVVLVAVAWRRRRNEVVELLRDRRAMRGVLALGVVYYAVTQAAQFVAIVHQPAASTSLTLAATVVVVAVLSRVTLGEPITRATLVGGAVIVAGSLAYLGGDLGFTMAGTTAATVALAANSAATLLGRHVNRQAVHRPVVVTAVSMAAGAVVLMMFALAARRPMPSVSPATALVVGWMAFVNTALAFSLWSWVLRRLPAAQAASINNLMLVEVAALGWVFLGEGPGLLDVVGIGVVTIGVLATQGVGLRRS